MRRPGSRAGGCSSGCCSAPWRASGRRSPSRPCRSARLPAASCSPRAGRPASGWSTSTASRSGPRTSRSGASRRCSRRAIRVRRGRRRSSSASRAVSSGWTRIAWRVPPTATSPIRRCARTQAVRWASTSRRSSTSSAPATNRRSTSSTGRRPSQARPGERFRSSPIAMADDGTFTALADFPEPVGPAFWNITS